MSEERRVTRSQASREAGAGENTDFKNASSRGYKADKEVSPPRHRRNRGKNENKGMSLLRKPIHKDKGKYSDSEDESVHSSHGSRGSSPESKVHDGESSTDGSLPQSQPERSSPFYDDSKKYSLNITESDDAGVAHAFQSSLHSRSFEQVINKGGFAQEGPQSFKQNSETIRQVSNQNLHFGEERFNPRQRIPYSEIPPVKTSFTAHRDSSHIPPVKTSFTAHRDSSHITPVKTPFTAHRDSSHNTPETVIKREGTQSSGRTYLSQFSDDDLEPRQWIPASPTALNKTLSTDHKTSPVLTHGPSAKKTTQVLCLLLGTLLIASFIAVIGVIFVSELTQKHGESVNLNAFQAQVGELRSAFPSQSEILWKRSQRILERHLNNSHPKEPAILLLTAATNAEETLLCLSRRLAQAYAISRKGTYTVILGTHRTFDDGKEAKLLIDETLSNGFKASSKAAVLHRLESLPPGSILILYKYCDHENAAYKNVALFITVLLPDETLDPNMDLKELEEKVRDFLKDKFIGSNPDENISHSDMDMDKLSGVWSRIAHVVLPVRPESNNQEGCKDVE